MVLSVFSYHYCYCEAYNLDVNLLLVEHTCGYENRFLCKLKIGIGQPHAWADFNPAVLALTKITKIIMNLGSGAKVRWDSNEI